MYRILFILLFQQFNLFGQSADTVNVYSASMNKNIRCVIIQPDRYKKNIPLPVVYLLHGYGGKYNNWINKVPEIKKYASLFNMIIVCPDGFNSWYFNSITDTSQQLETFLSEELIKYVDKNYKTISKNTSRAITGLSMGGHGAMYLGLKYPEIFGACGSMSGVTDLSVRKNKYDIIKILGDTILQAASWKNHSVMYIIENPQSKPAIIFDCGTSDGFINENRMLHQKMEILKIPHQYTERNGNHNWIYWAESIPYQLLFFRNYFKAK